MKISLSCNQFFDDKGAPLSAGRITVYLHDSDTPCTVYTLAGEIYSEAVNPILTSEDGRIPTLFFDAAVVDVKVEKANGDGSYELLDTYQDGFNMPSVKNDTVINGLEGLKEANTELGVVSVYGYDEHVVAPMRNYIWDPTCREAADDGIVVMSNTTETGRWILLWDDEKLPCSIYGVAPGYEANISSFVGYPEVVSQWNILTPKMPRFLSGEYTSDTTYTTTKTLYFDVGAKFRNADFVCRSAVIPANNSYVADFDFTDHKCEAHSSWFRTAIFFYNCGADKLVIDPENYFTDSVIKGVANISGKTLIGTTRLNVTYSNGGYVQISDKTRCEKLFSSANDYLRITGIGTGDSVFGGSGTWDPGLISQGHHVQYDQTPDIDTFANANWWMSAMLERRNRLNSTVWSDYTLDLQGRTVSSIYLSETSFTTIKNGTFTGTITARGYYLTLENVTASVMVNSQHEVGLMLTATNSHVEVQRYHHGLTSLTAVDSYISIAGAEGLDPCDTAISVYGGIFNGYVKMSTDNCNAYKANKNVSFQKCSITGGFPWRLNRIYMVNCASDCKIDLYPAADAGQNPVYRYNCLLQKNNFTGNFRLWITYYWDAEHPHYQVRGTNVKFNQLVITDNNFNTIDVHGIKMINWHVGYLDYYMYANYQDMDMGTWRYQNNTGNCPLMCPGLMDNSTNWETYRKDPVNEIESRRSSGTYYLFDPYIWARGGTSSDAPSSFLNPADPNHRVLANIHGNDFKDSWAFVDTWYANGLNTPEVLADEDYNNRFLVYVWMNRMNDDVPNWHNTSGFAYTSFILPSTHA